MPVVLVAACVQAPKPDATLTVSQPVVASAPANQPHSVPLASEAMVPSPSQKAIGVPDDPAKFKGLSSREVRSLLGTPVFLRRDAPAELWQYRSRACTLDLFLYDSGLGDQRVDHWVVRGPAHVNGADCVHQLVEQRASAQSGS